MHVDPRDKRWSKLVRWLAVEHARVGGAALFGHGDSLPVSAASGRGGSKPAGVGQGRMLMRRWCRSACGNDEMK
jgi:hypothetical protein